ncbi:caspase 8, apoptosis-related cysteine peptidase, like 1 isoform X2 [Puntigrus tetrazona]|uniref:caspase 8, apoptosis-related cysteine peptidase, like 1 isoform X2 n=1 Tax=Puntigrus tetrazona TaxID=1606681 RepID=UPI001C896543|nr:caspase 8, apoptosis-related cysteine peptidase, like 1 isoform X2 [Puntigrus tetrazona]
MDTTGDGNRNRRSQRNKNQQVNASASSKRTKAEDKENVPVSVQKTNEPKRKREPLQPTGSIPDHYPKKKRLVSTQKEFYSMSNRPLGHCLIINNFNFEKTSLGNRKGTDKDKENLIRVFKNMFFEVEVCDDLQASDMQNVIKELAERDHSKMGAFVCCILSHGEKGSVLGIDGKPVLIRKLTQPFAECHTLVNKPKLFFIQACQGNEAQQGVWMADGQENTREEGTFEEDSHTGASHSIPKDADFLIGIATVERYKSFRHTKDGSIFIQELCKHLESGCRKKEDILSVLTKVNRIVSSRILQGCKQMPEVRYTLTKTLVLPIKQGS